MSDLPHWVTQPDDEVALDWGPNGLRAIAAGPGLGDGAVVIVDVLRFTTAVDVAVGRGAIVLAYRWDRPEDAAAFATERGAVLGARGDEEGPGLSPASLVGLAPGQRIVLPSPNGAALVVGAAERGAGRVVAACLRNAEAVADALTAGNGNSAGSGNRRIAIVAAGERWRGGTGPLRVAAEDLLGAGAVASALRARGWALSSEAAVAAGAFEGSRDRLPQILAGCASGRELVARGRAVDVAMAAELHVSRAVPALVGDELVDAAAAPR